LAVHPTDTDIVLAGGRQIDYKAVLFKTTDGGENWINLSCVDLYSSQNIDAICFDPFDHDRIYLGTVFGVYISTDGGNNWTSPSFYPEVTCMIADPTRASRIFIGTDNGVYTSLSGGVNWYEMNDGLTNLDVQCMEFDSNLGILYVGTNGGGVFRYTIGTGIEDPGGQEIPMKSILHQNYPNPFNMHTEITCELPVSGSVHLAVYNVQGRLIRILMDGPELSGRKTVFWDGRDTEGREVSSGLYIYRLDTDTSMEMRKMILQK